MKLPKSLFACFAALMAGVASAADAVYTGATNVEENVVLASSDTVELTGYGELTFATNVTGSGATVRVTKPPVAYGDLVVYNSEGDLGKAVSSAGVKVADDCPIALIDGVEVSSMFFLNGSNHSTNIFTSVVTTNVVKDGTYVKFQVGQTSGDGTWRYFRVQFYNRYGTQLFAKVTKGRAFRNNPPADLDIENVPEEWVSRDWGTDYTASFKLLSFTVRTRLPARAVTVYNPDRIIPDRVRKSGRKVASNIDVADVVGLAVHQFRANNDTLVNTNTTVSLFRNNVTNVTYQAVENCGAKDAVRYSAEMLYNSGTDLYAKQLKGWAYKLYPPDDLDIFNPTGVWGSGSENYVWPYNYDDNFGTVTMSIYTKASERLTLRCARTNELTGVTMSVEDGVELVVANGFTLPKASTVTVQSNAVMRLDGSYGNYGQNGGDTEIHVERGGKLIVNKGGAIGRDCTKGVVVDGGELCFAVDPGYANVVTLQNGARVWSKKRDYMPWLLYTGTTKTWYVKGTSPSSLESSIQMASFWPTTRKFNLDVADVTGDAEPDLYMSGDIIDYDSGHRGGLFVKKGAGTVYFTGRFSATNALHIVEGTWYVATSNAFSKAGKKSNFSGTPGNSVSLEGGTLAGANVTNTVNELFVTTNSAIALSPETRFNFGDQNAQTWTAGARVTLRGFVKGARQLRFGTTATGLSPSQLRAFRDEDDNSFMLDSEGYLDLRPRCLVITFR